jgi:ferredoxin
MPRVTVEGVGTFSVPAGKRLVNALTDECDLDQLHVCGGNARCGTCRVTILGGTAGAMRAPEASGLRSCGLADRPGVRLACQITCDADMVVRAESRLGGSGRLDPGPRPADVICHDFPGEGELDPVREVETFRIVKWLTSPTDGGGAADEPLYRPILRSPVPVLTVLDDGSMDVGEEIRIRKSPFVIGRSSGDLTLPNDPTVSKEHAEIRLVETRGIRHWRLNNLDSTNGTFVRVNQASCYVDTILIIGSRRYRLEGAFQQPGGAVNRAEDGTLLLPWPSLVDSSGSPDARKYAIRKPMVKIGGMDGGGDIELDDPLVAKQHATLHRDSHGVWQVRAGQTRNGVWANIHSADLTSYCYFQCGEQRFRFMIP